MKAEERKTLAVEIAKLYYIDHMSQDEIAKLTQMSRANVSRILNKCVSDGIVEISVHDTLSKRPELARKIQLAFGLSEVIIAPSSSSLERTYRNMGEQIAKYLMRILRNGMLFGVNKGRASYYAARSIENKLNLHVDVIQLQGAVSHKATSEDGQGLASLFASKLNGTAYVLNAPLMVKSKQTKLALLQSEMIGSVFQRYAGVDTALIEIERPRVHAWDAYRLPWLARADMLQLEEMDVVSCLCGYFYDAQGNPCNVGIHERMFAADAKLIRDKIFSIGVASGESFYMATLSVLRAGMLNTLILDEKLAAAFEENADQWDNA